MSFSPEPASILAENRFITPRKINMEPENTGPPGEGKSSEPKHHFPAATLNFGGALGGRFK